MGPLMNDEPLLDGVGLVASAVRALEESVYGVRFLVVGEMGFRGVGFPASLALEELGFEL